MTSPRAELSLPPEAAEARLHRLAVAGTLVLPLALMHSRALAEIVIGAVDVLFLTHATLRHDWTWTGAPWLIATALWCGWVMVCAPFGVSGWPTLAQATLAQATLAQATLALRLPLFAAALGTWVLTRPDDRRWLHWVVTAAAAWIALECWQQYLLGTNLFGQPRWGDGALTGPFNQPRAGSALFFVLLPALVPAAIALLARRAALARMGGVILPVAGVATMVLIGQRMPTLLTLLALVASGLLLRRLRIAVAATLGAAALLVAATPVISPATFHKLVVRFAEQMAHFPSSNYGLLYIRATVIALAHPWLGIGYDGFRAGCPDPAYARGLPALGVPDSASGGIDACNIHPHNFYLEAAVNAGVPGLVLFAVAATAMLITLGRHLAGQPIRVALFATMLGALWPLASTNDFYSVPNAGWLMLLLGWGLAERSRA